MIKAATHVSIFVDNQDEALKFYTEKLGFTVHDDTLFGDMRWLTLNAKGQNNFFVVLYAATKKEDKDLVGKQGGSAPLLCLESDNIEKDYNDMSKKGVQFVDAIEENPWGKSITLKDLYGNQLYLVQPPQ